MWRRGASGRCCSAGLWDEVQQKGSVDIEHSPAAEPERSDAARCLQVPDGIGWVRLEGNRLEPAGIVKTLLQEPRGLYELGYAYEPVMNALDSLLSGKAVFGKDVQRRTDWVGIGSGRLCQQLPYPVLGDLVARYGGKRVIDLGCGDGAFMIWMLRHIPGPAGNRPGPRRPDRRPRPPADRRGGTSPDRAAVVCGDMFDLVSRDGSTQGLPDLSQIDTITVCDTFHEYLWEGEKPIVDFLKGLKSRRPGITVIMGDFCVQDEEWLRRHPIASLEHHLWHDLTRQRLISEAQWRQVFDQAGMQVVDSRVFDLIGHGYFVLR